MEITESSTYVIIAGGTYEFDVKVNWPIFQIDGSPGSLESWLITIVNGAQLFTHTSKTGIISLVKLTPGMPVQIVPGVEFKRIVQEQRYAAMQAQGMRPTKLNG